MTMTPVKKLATALSLAMISVGGIAATPAMARDHYRPGDYYRGYDRAGYDYRHYRGYRDRDRDYYRNRGYYRDSDYYRYRCRDNGTGGAIIGAIAGGLLGNEVARDGNRTTGAVLGAAVGALAGHAIDKGDRRC